mmetsp:Transcript_7189/g.17525  ORF Transcript_7189/g.17525 Transcript_7189/m.17525 type:complete len:151 (+) Transcript_7189:298-750(+)
MTLQGRAIKRAAIDFGDGKTLPFAPCKRGYAPWVEVRPKSRSDGAKRCDKGDNGVGGTAEEEGNVIEGTTDGRKRDVEYKRMVACSFHEKHRRKRLARDKGRARRGEADPDQLFPSKPGATDASENELEKRVGNGSTSNTQTGTMTEKLT